MANREITMDDLKSGDAIKRAPGNPQNPGTWDLDHKYVEYQEMVELGQVKESAALLREINREERKRERAVEIQEQQQVQVKSVVDQLIEDHPTLGDVNHPDHEAVMAWANYYQRDKGMSRIDALKKASTRTFSDVKPEPKSNKAAKEDETPQEMQARLIKEKKIAAQKKNAKAREQQPPDMDLGSDPEHSVDGKDIENMSSEEWAKLTEKEKAIARGDFLVKK